MAQIVTECINRELTVIEPAITMLLQQNEEAPKTYEEKRAAERTAELARPFLERKGWRKARTYQGWTSEPVVETVGDHIAITRSNYGYRVLNTPDLGMIDVDFNLEFDAYPQEKEVLSNLRDWVANHGSQSWRVYRTAAGMRLLRTDAPQLLDDSFQEVCAGIYGVDTLYVDLCVEQAAFRLRVSPKPHRIGIKYPDWNPYDEGDGWSHSDPEHTRVPLTIQAYEILQTQYKTCELVAIIGSGDAHSSLRHVLEVHDMFCKVDSKLEMESIAENEGADYLPSHMEILAFNEVYRPHEMAADLIWDILHPSLQLQIRNHLEREWVMNEWEQTNRTL